MNDLRMSDVLQRLHAEYGDRAPSYVTMQRRVTEGRIPAHRRGTQWRFKAADLAAIRAGLGLPPIAAPAGKVA
jgi:hypothetical protein